MNAFNSAFSSAYSDKWAFLELSHPDWSDRKKNKKRLSLARNHRTIHGVNVAQAYVQFRIKAPFRRRDENRRAHERGCDRLTPPYAAAPTLTLSHTTSPTTNTSHIAPDERNQPPIEPEYKSATFRQSSATHVDFLRRRKVAENPAFPRAGIDSRVAYCVDVAAVLDACLLWTLVSPRRHILSILVME